MYGASEMHVSDRRAKLVPQLCPGLPSFFSEVSPYIDNETTQHFRVIELDGLIHGVLVNLQRYPIALELVSTVILTVLPDDI